MESARGVYGVAALGIGCSIDDSAYLRPADGSCAHRARFDGDVESSVRQVFAAESFCGRRDGLYLRVSGDIGERLCEVVSATDYLILADNHATDRNLVGFESFLRFAEGEAHEALIGIPIFRLPGIPTEFFQFFGMGLEVVADDNDICAGFAGGVHGFGCADATTDDEGDGSNCTNGFYDLGRDGCYGSGACLQIDGFFAH